MEEMLDPINIGLGSKHNRHNNYENKRQVFGNTGQYRDSII